MSWSAEELDVLKRRADEGLSAKRIAEHLPNRSRNAVIGMLRRGDGKYGTLQGQPKNEAIGRATPKTDIPPKRPYRPVGPAAPSIEVPAGADISSSRVEFSMPWPPTSPVELLFVSPDCVSYSKPAVVEAPVDVANLPAPLPITFLAAVMTDRCLHYACDWFAPDGPDMPVCGAERAQDVLHTRYCRRHLISQRQPRVAA